MPELNEQQIKQYNAYRAEGMTPERALSLATKDSDNQYNPALEMGTDKILFGKGSLTEAIGKGLKSTFIDGPKAIADDAEKYGAGYAFLKSPLTLAAGAGRGVGDIIGGALETADDLVGESVSGFLTPYVEGAVNSDVGEYLIKKAIEFDQNNRGIPGDLLDVTNLLGITGLVKTGAAKSIKTGIINSVDDVIKNGVKMPVGRSLADFIPKSGGGIVDTVVDTAVEGGVKVIKGVKAIPEKISEAAKTSIDRRIVRIATTDPEKASDTILDLYKRSVVPGVKKKNKTIANIENIDDAIKRAVPDLAKKYEVDDLQDFAIAIGTEKKAIFAEIEKGLVEAGKQGKIISTEPIVKELDSLLTSERAEFSEPLRKAIERARKELVMEKDGVTLGYKEISPSGAQDLIADLNAQLQSFYRGSTSGTNADVIVDNLVVNNLRKAVDDVVDDLGEGSFKELKSRYADLKKMEDDVVHRAVFEAQKGGGLADLTDILSAGDVAAGMIDPTFFAKGAAQFLTKEVIKSLNDKDELVRQMFLYGKNLSN